MKFTRDDVKTLRMVEQGFMGSALAEIADKIESTFKPPKPKTDLKFLHYRPWRKAHQYIGLAEGYLPAISFGWTSPRDGKVVVAVARQNPKDNFCRHIARTIIENRINSGDGYIIEVGDDVVASILEWARKKNYIDNV